MERRDALKKIGLGGAAVVGSSSLIISSPGFAAGDPSVTGEPSVFNLINTGTQTANVVVSGFPIGACPESATGGPAQDFPTYEWSAPGGDGVGTNVDNGGLAWSAGDEVEVTVTVRYTCTYPGAPSSRDVSWSRVFTKTGPGAIGGWAGGTTPVVPPEPPSPQPPPRAPEPPATPTTTPPTTTAAPTTTAPPPPLGELPGTK